MTARPLRTGRGQHAVGRSAGLILLLLPLFAATALCPPPPAAGAWGVWQWLPWSVGIAALFTLALLRRRREGRSDALSVAVMALCSLLLFSGTVVVTGGAGSPLWPGYFLFITLAGSRFRRWWQQPLLWAAVALLDIGQAWTALASGAGLGERVRTFLFVPGGLRPEFLSLAGRLALLAAFSVLLYVLYLRRQNRLHRSLRDHIRLREEADHIRGIEEDRTGKELEDHSPEGKMIRRMSTAEKLNRDIDRLLELTRRAVGARVVIYLESDGSRLAVRRDAADGASIDRKMTWRVGEGILGGAAKLCKSVLLSDVTKGRQKANLVPEGNPTRSLMVVPVVEHDVARGILVADHQKPDKFTRGEQEVFEGFSLEVNLLLENFRESSLRDRRTMTLETLLGLSRELTKTLRTEEMMEALVEKIRQVIPYDQCAVFFVDKEHKRIVLQTQRGFRFERNSDVYFPVGKRCLVNHLVKHGQPLVFADRKKMDIIPGYTGIEKMRSFLGLPLRFRDDLDGAMIFASAATGSFTHYHLETLELLTGQMAAQISNAFLHRQVEKMAITDGLTGLYNHRTFQERLDHELERTDRSNKHLSLLLLDIDHFKKINDSYGHPFGDIVLKGVAARLSEIARTIDLVARYGGEEFALILPETARRGCQTMALRVLKNIEALRFDFEGKDVAITVSVGSSTYPEEGKDKDAIVRHADQALYLAKESGRNQYKSFRDVIRE